MVTPVYADDLVTLYHGDCRTVLPALSLEADLAVVDPPYGDTSLAWDKLTTEWVAPLAAALKPHAPLWLWGSLRSLIATGPVLMADGWQLSQDVVWEKHNGSGSAADRFRRVHEQAALFYRGAWDDVHHEPQFTNDATARQMRRKQRPAHWGDIGGASYRTTDGGPRLTRSVIYERSAQGNAIHPTQKPEASTETLIRYACPPGGLVVDPFAGSCTTLVAARSAGRRSIGIELDGEMCERAAQRLSQGCLDFGEAS